MNVGDHVRIVEQVYAGENYPWVPVLIGQTGTIAETKMIEDETIYCVRQRMVEDLKDR